jgi:hypothetical protein
MLESSWVAAQLVASQESLSSVELDNPPYLCVRAEIPLFWSGLYTSGREMGLHIREDKTYLWIQDQNVNCV